MTKPKRKRAARRGEVVCSAATVIRMATAIQRFRNVKMLGRLITLRTTPEYHELCEAWRDYRDETQPNKLRNT